MDALTSAILLALVPFFSFGISTGMQKKYVESLGAARLITYRGIILALVLWPLALAINPQENLDWPAVAFAVTVSAISYFGLYFMNKALSVGKVGAVVPVTSGRVLLTTLISVSLLSEHLAPGQLLAIVVIFMGIAASSINLNDFKDSQIFNLKSGVPYAVLAALFWGGTFAFFGIPSAKLGAFLFAAILETSVLAVSVVQILLQRNKLTLSRVEWNDNVSGVVIIGMLGVIASAALNLGYATGYVSIVSAISGASPLVSILYSRVVYKEKLKSQQYYAAALIIIGIVALSIIK